MLIARLIAEPATLESGLAQASAALATRGWPVAQATMLEFCSNVLEIEMAKGDRAEVRAVLDAAFPGADLLLSDQPFTLPRVFVSDMDSTMIGQECIDELADFAGLKPQIAAITERAMQGELDFESALRERVALLAGLSAGAIDQCLAERIRPVEGAKTLVATLKAHGCRAVLVTGGFHQFADVVAAQLGFERVVANRLEVAGGHLTGGLLGAICHSGTKLDTLIEEAARAGDGTVSLATGDGANDIPMIAAATYGVAYRAKPKARLAADGWVESESLTAILRLLGIPQSEWVTA
ncbi:phosphoserine phosphatase SerB [Novosphingobium sp.]|uniref:phosphoserine phosphatase SerB n=1 Tax=Novosphingobium sp. TaxID=1874826 RepID=UPI0034544E43